jgi:hypothetical protein
LSRKKGPDLENKELRKYKKKGKELEYSGKVSKTR